SEEFMVYTPAGEDKIASCASCKYAANLEKATSRISPVEDLWPEGDGKPLLVHTPGKGAIADVAEFLKVSPRQDIKTVAYMAKIAPDDGKAFETPVAVFLRGDHTVNETKLLTLVRGTDLRPMVAEELTRYFKGPGGFIGPVGLTVRESLPEQDGGPADSVTVVLDKALEGRQNLICGANQLDYHFKNVTPGRDFLPTIVADIRS